MLDLGTSLYQTKKTKPTNNQQSKNTLQKNPQNQKNTAHTQISLPGVLCFFFFLVLGFFYI